MCTVTIYIYIYISNIYLTRFRERCGAKSRRLQSASKEIPIFVGIVTIPTFSQCSLLKILHCVCRRWPCNCAYENYAIIRQIKCVSVFVAVGNDSRITFSNINFLCKCYHSIVVKEIPVMALITTCIYMNFDNEAYVTIPMNKKERKRCLS